MFIAPAKYDSIVNAKVIYTIKKLFFKVTPLFFLLGKLQKFN
nr:MAG TPA: hypothetical protein [Caudoviricetes sp.]